MLTVKKDRSLRTYPLILCDVCGQLISEPGMAMARWKPLAKDESTTEIAICHKGTCDEELNRTRQDDHWEELTHFLCRLMHNCGMTDEHMVAARESVDRLSLLP